MHNAWPGLEIFAVSIDPIRSSLNPDATKVLLSTVSDREQTKEPTFRAKIFAVALYWIFLGALLALRMVIA